jgi:hypothetical protein
MQANGKRDDQASDAAAWTTFLEDNSQRPRTVMRA